MIILIRSPWPNGKASVYLVGITDDVGSIPEHVIPKTLKKILAIDLLGAQH